MASARLQQSLWLAQGEKSRASLETTAQAPLLRLGCCWCAWEAAAAAVFGVVAVEASPGAAVALRAGWAVSAAEGFVAGAFVGRGAAAAAAVPPGLPEAFARGYCFVGD